jgi:hypothetical protein
MPCPVAITWTFVMSPTISNTGYEDRGDRVSAYREGHHTWPHLAPQANFDFFCPPSGVGQGLGDVLGFQVGILAENLVARPSCGRR